MENSDIAVADERTVLKALCVSPGDGDVWESATRALHNHQFRDTAHQLLYEALQPLRNRAPDVRREHVLRQVAKAGFPDLDLREFFSPSDATPVELWSALSRLAEK